MTRSAASSMSRTTNATMGTDTMMEIDGWSVYRSAYGNIVAINNDNHRRLFGDTLDEIIIKIDQANHPERCSE